jgi:S1-C subfamily serine protease
VDVRRSCFPPTERNTKALLPLLEMREGEKIRMRRTAFHLWCLLSVAFALGGCANRIDATRRASFSPFSGARIGNESVSQFAVARTAFIISADGLTITPSEMEPSGFRAEISGPDVELGSAAAIDRRGYFLAAAHCVKGNTTYLLRGSAPRGGWERASVVAKGNISKNGPDFALLYVPTGADQVFDWAPSYKVEDSVISVGPNPNEEKVEIVCFAGKIANVRQGADNDPYQAVITHTGPSRHGDSGGPLLGLDGRLIAINIASVKESKKTKIDGEARTIAVRPQVASLQSMIDSHARTALLPASNGGKARR